MKEAEESCEKATMGERKGKKNKGAKRKGAVS